MEEENFPRGKVKTKNISKKKSSESAKADRKPVETKDVLFKDGNLGKEKKKKTRKRKADKQTGDPEIKKQNREDEENSELLSTKDIVKYLSIKNLTEETLLLGVVREIHDVQIIISLPNNLKGYVQITDINDKYTERLREEQQKGSASNKDDSDNEDDQQEVPTLHEAFSVGDVVICKVKEVRMRKGYTRILLTLNPADITSHLAVDNLKETMILPGSVTSKEDHGFMIDVGIAGVTVFLQSKDANQYIHNQNQGKTLFIGQLLQCAIKEVKSNGRSLFVTIDRKSIIKLQAQDTTHTTLQSFMPGTRVEASITYVGQRFLGALVHSMFKSSIMDFHLKDCLQNTTDYKMFDKVSACVLFNCPVTKTLGLTLKPEYSDPATKLKKSFFGGLAIGDFVNKAKVERIDQKIGLIVDLKKDVHGLVVTSHIQVGEKAITNLEENFKLGQTVKGRIIDLNFIDNLAIVSMKSAILSEQYLALKDVIPGEKVKGTITAIQDNGLRVRISSHIHGFVPRVHLADVPIKNPNKIFSESDKISLRVIEVVSQQNRLILTHKKTLVKSKLPIVCDFSHFEEGMYVHGTIVNIQKFGCIVMFCNEVKGLIPRKELANEPVEFPNKVFYIGQVVKCRVIETFEPAMKRVILSLRSNSLTKPKKEKKEEPKVAVGTIMKVTVLSSKADDLYVKMENGQEAIIPKMHLSDYTSNCDILLAAATAGDEMQAMMFNNKGPAKQQILTCKPSLIEVSKADNMLGGFSDLQCGMQMVGCLRNIMPYGVFVEFLNNIIGLAPLKDVSDSFASDPSTLFKVGQTIYAHVKEVNGEKKRFLLSLRPSEVSVDVTPIDIVKGFFKEQSKIFKELKNHEKYKTISKINVGASVTATIKEIQKGDFLCQLKNVSAVVRKNHCPFKHDHKPGDKIQAVILHVDFVNEVVELSMKEYLVNFAKASEKEKLSKKEELRVKVELVKEYFVLASTEEGALLYLPTKKHYNDVKSGEDIFKVGECFKAKVYGTITGKQVAEVVKETCDSDDESQKFIRFGPKEMEAKARQYDVTRGSIVEARVHSVKEGQVNVVVNDKVQGRIHITEIVDNPTPHGKGSLDGFKVKQFLKARVIGYREMRMNRSLKITNQFTQLGLELSVKPSKLSDEYVVPSRHVSAKKQLHSFQPGQQVTVFTQQFSSNILWVHVTPYVGGKIHRLNISKKLSVLENPDRHFKKPGQAVEATVLGLDDEEKVLQLSIIGEQKKEIKEKTIVNGCIKKVLTDRLCVQLPFGYFGSVFITDIRDHLKEHPLEGFKADQYVRCAVLDAEDRHNVTLSLRPSRISKHNDPGADQELMSLDDLKEGAVCKGYVSECNQQALFICLSRTVTGTVKLNNVSEYYIEDFSSVFPVGKLVSVKIIRVNKDKDKVSMSMLPKDTGLPDAVPEHLRGHFKVSKKESRKRQRKQRRLSKESDDSGMEESSSDEEEETATSVPSLKLSSGFSWDVNLSKLGQIAKEDDVDSSSEEEEDDEPEKKKMKKENTNDKKSEEAEIQQAEQSLMQEDRKPESVDDFNRLLISSPNSSMVWIGFMAFHLQNTEAEKARAVAERALETINFREEQEKLNVWVAYLNLENMYGTEETLVKVFERALQQCEPIKVFQQLISIYLRTTKIEAADQLFTTMVKRFRSNKDVWINYGSFLMQNGKQDAAHKLMQRSFKSLETKQHVDVIVKFAQMEFKFGEPERGKTMFDNVLSSYSKRTDIWSVYLDMVIKQTDASNTRNLFERVITLDLPPKKIKFFFKRYLDYEKKFGDDGTVKAVKEKAVKYVEKKSSDLG
ncbi:protein RRP5 homolog [Antedon mediterranea]|uniref:protein RRP5 homolog n=1 Tax=Antedon mediterranea TaxID=105859 RepID=UPI003AF9DE2D